MKKLISMLIIFAIMTSFIGCQSKRQLEQDPYSEKETSLSEPDTREPDSNPKEKITEFRFEDFGGVADGETDNMLAMNKLLSSLKFTVGKKSIVFGEGVYKFVPTNNSYAIRISNVVDLEIRGQGPDKTHIVLGNSLSGFLHVTNGVNITTRGLSVEHDPLPFTQGTIVAVDPGNLTYDLKIDDGYGLPTEDWYTADIGQGTSFRTSHIMDGETRTHKKNTVTNVFVDKQVEDLGNRVFRFRSSRSGMSPGLGREAWREGHISVGDKIAVLSRAAGGHNLFYENCENTLFEDIHVYSSKGFSLLNVYTRGTAVARRITIKRKHDRLIAVNADGIAFGACRAKPLIEDCYIEATCDDAISGQAPSAWISHVESPEKIFIQTPDTSLYLPEDRVTVFDQRAGRLVGESRIVSANPHNIEGLGAGYMVTLENPIEGVTPSNDPAMADLFMNANIINTGMTIRNNTVYATAGRAVFLHAQDLLVENNTFREIGGHALMLATEGPSRTNGYPRNVVIRNNTFENTTYMKKYVDMWGTIHIGVLRNFYPAAGDRTIYITAAEAMSDNISITDNEFINTSGCYIFLSAVKDSVIENNILRSDKGFQVLQNDALVIAENSKNITIRKNTISDFREGLEAIVEGRGNTPEGPEGIKLENNTVDSNPGVPMTRY